MDEKNSLTPPFRLNCLSVLLIMLGGFTLIMPQHRLEKLFLSHLNGWPVNSLLADLHRFMAVLSIAAGLGILFRKTWAFSLGLWVLTYLLISLGWMWPENALVLFADQLNRFNNLYLCDQGLAIEAGKFKFVMNTSTIVFCLYSAGVLVDQLKESDLVKKFFTGFQGRSGFAFMNHCLLFGSIPWAAHQRRKAFVLMGTWSLLSCLFWIYGLDHISGWKDSIVWIILFGGFWLIGLGDAVFTWKKFQTESFNLMKNILYILIGCYFLIVSLYPLIRIVSLTWQQNCSV